VDDVTFGRTGLKVSRLSIGTGTNGYAGRSEQTKLGIEGLAALLHQGYELGVNFWDAADGYGSHAHLAQALKGLPRDKIVIATKTEAHTADQATRDIERYLRELQTDVIDVVLLHYRTAGDWPRRSAGAMEALSRAKEKGLIRAVGVSCHGFAPLKAAAQSDWVEAILVRINYAGKNMDAPPDKVAPVIEQMYRSGKAIYGMKVMGAGALRQDPRRAIDYVLGLGTVHALTIGVTSVAELEQNAKLVEEASPRYPLQSLAPVR